MKFRQVLIFILLVLKFSSANVWAQTSRYHDLQLGDTIPSDVWDNIWLGVDLEEKANKKPLLTILDFWTTFCTHCIAAFPEMERLQRHFKDSISIVLVNASETTAEVQERMGVLRERNRQIEIPDLPMLNGASFMKDIFPYRVVPHHVWVDSNRVVQSVTSGFNTTQENIQAFLSQGYADMVQKQDIPDFDRDSPLWLQANGKYRQYTRCFAVFMNQIPGAKAGLTLEYARKNNNVKALRAVNLPLLSLFRIAYGRGSILGLDDNPFRFNNRTEIDVEDLSKLIRPTDRSLLDKWNLSHTFCYEIQVDTNDFIDPFYVMQRELEFFSDYLVKIEKRNVPSLQLIVLDSVKFLDSQASVKEVEPAAKDVFKLEGVPFSNFTGYLANRLKDYPEPFVDATGYIGEVSVLVDTRLDCVEDWNSELQLMGLKIVKSLGQVDILVIKDK